MKRTCGSCSMCCKLLPMHQGSEVSLRAAAPYLFDGNAVMAFDKPANERCPYQRHHKGCTIYARRPLACRIWSCAWLDANDTADQRRPDHSHVVIDPVPDVVRMTNPDTDQQEEITVIQIWCDPRFPEAHRAPEVRAFMARRGEEGLCILVRFDSNKALFVAPPGGLFNDGKWHETEQGPTGSPAHFKV